MTKTQIHQSRAVLHRMGYRSAKRCASCQTYIRGNWKNPAKVVICNVFDHEKFVRVEYHHDSCYAEHKPYGELVEPPRGVN